jgi:hypothetical protein
MSARNILNDSKFYLINVISNLLLLVLTFLLVIGFAHISLYLCVFILFIFTVLQVAYENYEVSWRQVVFSPDVICKLFVLNILFNIKIIVIAFALLKLFIDSLPLLFMLLTFYVLVISFLKCCVADVVLHNNYRK